MTIDNETKPRPRRRRARWLLGGLLLLGLIAAGYRQWQVCCKYPAKSDIYMVITVDIEALPGRGASDHIERLIYGNFGPGKRAGIDEMMNAADAANVKISFFLDVLEETIYPGQIEAVAKHITARGHDVQLHTHPHIMPAQAWSAIGIPRKQPYEFSHADATALFTYTQALFTRWGLKQPVAFRAGAYEYSRGIITAMPAFGLKYSYNYNPRAQSQRPNLGYLPMFTWDNQVTEIPISYVPHFFRPIRFGDNFLSNVDNMYKEVDRFGRATPDDNVLVMMMHSWSFLDLEGNFRVFKRDTLRQEFERFLRGLPKHIHVVSASQLHDLFETGRLKRPAVLPQAPTLLPAR